MKVKLNRVRISFADDIFNARAMEEGAEKKFGGEFILAPKHPDVLVLERAIETVGSEFFKDKWKGLKPKLDSEGRLCLRKQPRTNQEGEVYDGYEGMYWVRSSSKTRPLVLDSDKSPLTQQDGKIYSGCIVTAVLDVFGHFHAKGGNRVLAQIKGVQFIEDADAFGGGAPAKPDDFDDETNSETGEDDLAA